MSASDIRLKARLALSGKYWLAVLVTLIAGFFGGVSTTSVSVGYSETSGSITDLIGLFSTASNNNPESQVYSIILAVLSAIMTISILLFIGRFIVCGCVELGYSRFLLNLYDRKDCAVKDIFSQFTPFGRGFLQAFLRGLYVSLWSLLFIIPGIVKTYSYAMTAFIMVDDPNITPDDAITKSRKMMDGHKFDLFLLDLSFIGWRFLCVLTLGIGTCFLNPYIATAHAAFYREISSTNDDDCIAETSVQFTITER